MRTPTKDRLKDTVLHSICESMGFYDITVEDITEYMSRVPKVKEKMLSHREASFREMKRVEGLSKARQSKASKAGVQ